jgi:hypothetical protein
MIKKMEKSGKKTLKKHEKSGKKGWTYWIRAHMWH